MLIEKQNDQSFFLSILAGVSNDATHISPLCTCVVFHVIQCRVLQMFVYICSYVLSCKEEIKNQSISFSSEMHMKLTCIKKEP